MCRRSVVDELRCIVLFDIEPGNHISEHYPAVIFSKLSVREVEIIDGELIVALVQDWPHIRLSGARVFNAFRTLTCTYYT